MRPDDDFELPSVHAALRAAAERYPGRPALHVPRAAARPPSDDPVELSYRELYDRVCRRLEAFRAARYGAGQRVALMLDNRPEFFVDFYALNGLGASVVPMHPELVDAELGWRLEHCQAAAIIALPEHAGRLAGLSSLPVAGPSDDPPPVAEVSQAAPQPASEAAILYTSGTTARPKGCMLSNAYFIGLGRWYLGLGGLCELRPGRERLATPLPVSHMNAMACSSMAMLLAGGCLVQLDRFHPSSWWASVRESAATIVHYLGVMCGMLLAQPESADDDFSDQVRFGFGANVDPRHHQRFEQRFGFPLIEAWAMTETGSGACIAANREPRHVGSRCFGRPPASLEYRLVDETGAEVPAGQPGELLVRAAGADSQRGFFSGYFDDPEATEEAWRDGWFHTGDIVRIGADGSFYFVDRHKNLIRRSGENIAAVEVEAALLSSPLVQVCAVAAVPDALRGEEVMACIVPAAGVAADHASAERIFADCSSSLARFKAPGYIAFVDRLPTTSSQKVQRAALKTLCRERLAAGSCFDLRAAKRRSTGAES